MQRASGARRQVWISIVRWMIMPCVSSGTKRQAFGSQQWSSAQLRRGVCLRVGTSRSASAARAATSLRVLLAPAPKQKPERAQRLHSSLHSSPVRHIVRRGRRAEPGRRGLGGGLAVGGAFGRQVGAEDRSGWAHGRERRPGDGCSPGRERRFGAGHRSERLDRRGAVGPSGWSLGQRIVLQNTGSFS